MPCWQVRCLRRGSGHAGAYPTALPCPHEHLSPTSGDDSSHIRRGPERRSSGDPGGSRQVPPEPPGYVAVSYRREITTATTTSGLINLLHFVQRAGRVQGQQNPERGGGSRRHSRPNLGRRILGGQYRLFAPRSQLFHIGAVPGNGEEEDHNLQDHRIHRSQSESPNLKKKQLQHPTFVVF